ncbi:MAG TPA: 50S ribosomal protein L4 [bacterium]|jgi:large subunit ribosomal protein L4|nr:50S ribosomal protein L4 [bacterium]
MELKLLNKTEKGKEKKGINKILPESIFNKKLKSDVLKQYIRIYLSNQRQGTSKTKTRAEVSGGGRKPWRQKHTGRSRQGSIRSPIWVHGGVAHGPTPKSWFLNTTKDIRDIAMKTALSIKNKDNKLIVVENIHMDKPSTKDVVKALSDINVQGNILLVYLKRNWNVLKSVSNIPGVSISSVENLNAFEIVKSDYLIIDKESVKYLEKRIK